MNTLHPVAPPITFQAHYDNRRHAHFDAWLMDNHAALAARWKALPEHDDDYTVFEFARVQWELQTWAN